MKELCLIVAVCAMVLMGGWAVAGLVDNFTAAADDDNHACTAPVVEQGVEVSADTAMRGPLALGRCGGRAERGCRTRVQRGRCHTRHHGCHHQHGCQPHHGCQPQHDCQPAEAPPIAPSDAALPAPSQGLRTRDPGFRQACGPNGCAVT